MAGRLRNYSSLDKFLIEIETMMTTLSGKNNAKRANPADNTPEQKLDETERKHSVGLMRVNHSGEVCAQALYYGQSIVAKEKKIIHALQQSAEEESDHLAWTEQRIRELSGHLSWMNVIWYINAYCIGLVAGLAGDRWSLAFVEETERQVSVHLQKHLDKLSDRDLKSRAIVSQMKLDEEAHGQKAHELGADELPDPIKTLMGWHAKIMTTISYLI